MTSSEHKPQSVSNSEKRALAAGYNVGGEDRGRYIRAIAIGAHEELCGSWDAAGFDTKFAFITGAVTMLGTLEELGLDMFSFPGHGWRTG